MLFVVCVACPTSLQCTEPSSFKLSKSTAGEEAGLGLFFCGKCFKGDLVVGYSGPVGLASERGSHYSLQCGKTKWCVDATDLGEKCRVDIDLSIKKYPLGHMVNRPGKHQTSNLVPHT